MAEAYDGLPDDDIWNIEFADLEFTKELARGSFGKVFKGFYFGVEVAIKQILRHDDPAYMKYIEREISVLKGIRHPFIVGFCGVCLHSSGLYIVTEYVDGGDVRNLLKSGTVTWAKRVQIASDLAKAVYYLHSKKIIHRDLKSKNLLLGTDNRLRLCDFGFARISEFKVQRAMTICGTPGFVAPEIMLGNDYDESCDVFSYGNVLAELITFLRPGKDFWVRVADNQYEMDLHELKKFTPKECPPKFYELCLRCCEYEPSRRPDFTQILRYMKEIEAETPKDDKLASSGGMEIGINNNSKTIPQIKVPQSNQEIDNAPNSPTAKREGILSNHRVSTRNPVSQPPLQDEPTYLQSIVAQKIQLSEGELILSEKHLNKMVTRAVNPDYFDSDYLQDLLLFYPSFTTPQKLLDNIIQKHTSVALESFNFNGTNVETAAKKQQLYLIRIMVFLKTWIEKYSEDFEEPGMSELINTFDALSQSATNDSKDPPFSIANSLVKARTKKRSSTMVGIRIKKEQPKKPIDINQLTSFSANDLSKQIASIDYGIYKSVNPREFLKESWKRRSDSAIKGLTERCKELTRWVCTALLKPDDKETRCQLLMKFIDVAQNCLNLKNFSGFFAIMNALQHPAIERLHQTFNAMRSPYSQVFKSFQQITSKDNHYKAYKTKQEATLPPCVPYLDVFLEELSFLDSQYPDIGKGGIINFSKHRKMSRLVRHLVQYQDTPFADILAMDIIQDCLLTSQLYDDDILQKKSLIHEPPSTFDV